MADIVKFPLAPKQPSTDWDIIEAKLTASWKRDALPSALTDRLRERLKAYWTFLGTAIGEESIPITIRTPEGASPDGYALAEETQAAMNAYMDRLRSKLACERAEYEVTLCRELGMWL
jgi:hypothetical protein